MLKDIWSYLRAVGRHWPALLIGVGGAALTWWGALRGPLPPWLVLLVAALMFSVAQFLVWRDEALRVAALNEELTAFTEPGVHASDGLSVLQSKAFQKRTDHGQTSGLVVRLAVERRLCTICLVADHPVEHLRAMVSGPGEVNRPPHWERIVANAPVGRFRPPVGAGCQLDLEVTSPAGIERLMIEASDSND